MTLTAVTGRLLTRMTEKQLDQARDAAARSHVSVAEYVRERLARRIVGGRS